MSCVGVARECGLTWTPGSCGKQVAMKCECSTGQGRMTTLRCANQSRSLLVEGAILFLPLCFPPLTCQMLSNLLFVCHRDGHYGLYLDETLYEGSSARCPTFNNDPLCTSDTSPSKGSDGSNVSTATFECVGLEVWGVGLSS